MRELAKTLDRQFSGNAESRAAGMVINTMGWVEGLGYEVSSWFQMIGNFHNACWWLIYMHHVVILYFCSAVTSKCNWNFQGQCSAGPGTGKWCIDLFLPSVFLTWAVLFTKSFLSHFALADNRTIIIFDVVIILTVQFLAKYSVTKCPREANIFVTGLCCYQGIMLIVLKETKCPLCCL